MSAAVLILLLAPAASAQVSTESTHAAAAAELVEVLQLEQQMKLNIAQIQGPLTAMNPESERLAQVVFDFMQEVLPWEQVGPEYIRIYQSTFSEQEIRGLISFFGTPLGQKMIAEGPNLMGQSGAVLQKLMLPHQGELQRRVMDAMDVGR